MLPPARLIEHPLEGMCKLTRDRAIPIFRADPETPSVNAMKVRNSLKSLIKRHRNNRLVRRKGRAYVINKTNPRFKARQG